MVLWSLLSKWDQTPHHRENETSILMVLVNSGVHLIPAQIGGFVLRDVSELSATSLTCQPLLVIT